MKISVVIPAFNEEKLLGFTLQAVQSALPTFIRRGWQTEVIVCNNNSTDHTEQIAAAFGATVVFEEVNQIARARNRGAAAATGDWLIFVDADSKPSPKLFNAVAEEIIAGRCVAGGSTVKLEGNHPWANFLVGLWNLASRALNWCAGSFIFCETIAFRSVRGFSQELFATEEIDLSKKLKSFARVNGRRIVILHSAPLLTSARKLHLYSPREFLAFFFLVARSGDKTFMNREACHTWYDGRR